MKHNKHAAQAILAATSIVLLGLMVKATGGYVLPVDPTGRSAVGTSHWNDPFDPSANWNPHGPNRHSPLYAPVVPQPWADAPRWSSPTSAVRSPMAGVSGSAFFKRPYATGAATRFSSLPVVPRPGQNCQEPWCPTWPYSVNSDPLGYHSPQYYPHTWQRPQAAAPGAIWRS